MAEERIRQALLYENLGDRVQCHTCERLCLIPEGESGFCASRKNIGGQLYTLEYGDISSISANPIEKKPFFHFYPGTKALTIGSWSCNFTCPWCQNYDISKSPQNIGRGQYISPAAFVELVVQHHCQGTSISFNEPTMLFEYSQGHPGQGPLADQAVKLIPVQHLVPSLPALEFAGRLLLLGQKNPFP